MTCLWILAGCDGQDVSLHPSEIDAWNAAADHARLVAFECGGENIPDGEDATPADVNLVFRIERNDRVPDVVEITISTRPLRFGDGPADTIGTYIVHRVERPEWIPETNCSSR